MGGNPVGIEGAPVTDDVGTDIVACSLAVLELADDIQLAEGGKGVLGGAPGHTGGGRHGGDAGDTKGDQVGHIEATIKAGFGFAESHGMSRESGGLGSANVGLGQRAAKLKLGQVTVERAVEH